MHLLPSEFNALKQQPVERINEACGIYTRTILLERAGTYIPQHAHDHDHATLVCNGKARAWVDGACVGDFIAGDLVPIEANRKHVFMSLEPMTRLACIHDIESAESVKAKGV